MEGSLVQPKRIFLDTGHLINLVDLRLGRQLRGNQDAERVIAYQRLHELLNTGHLTPVFYEPSAYEWIHNNSLQGALQIAAVFDRAISVKRVLTDPLIFIVEAMQECQRIDPQIPFPSVHIVDDFGTENELGAWFHEAWPEDDAKPSTIPVLVEGGRASPTVQSVVRSLSVAFKSGTDLWQIALDGEAKALADTRKTQERHGVDLSVLDMVRRHWLRTYHFLDKVLDRVAPGVDATSMLESINLDACPAMQLKLDVYWNYARANATPKKGDMIDLTTFAVFPYVHFALIENRMHEFVRQVRRAGYSDRVFRDPVKFVASIAD